jgi:hypothetical protein
MQLTLVTVTIWCTWANGSEWLQPLQWIFGSVTALVWPRNILISQCPKPCRNLGIRGSQSVKPALHLHQHNRCILAFAGPVTINSTNLFPTSGGKPSKKRSQNKQFVILGTNRIHNTQNGFLLGFAKRTGPQTSRRTSLEVEWASTEHWEW